MQKSYSTNNLFSDFISILLQVFKKMTQSYRRPNYTTSNFSYDAWRLSGKPSCRKISIKEEFTISEKSPEPSSILTKRHTDEPEKTYHPFIVVGSCNEIDNLSTNTLSNKYSISTHSVDRISKYREQFSFSSPLSIRRKEFTSLENSLQKRSTTRSINQEKSLGHGKTFSNSVKTKRYTTVQSNCAQSNNSLNCETLKEDNKSPSKLEIKKFPIKRTSTPSHRKRISVKSFFSKKKNAASHNSVQDASEVGCSSWRSSTTKSPFSSPRKISNLDYNNNNNTNKPSQSPRKKVYYSEKQSDDINGVPSVPPTTPGRLSFI